MVLFRDSVKYKTWVSGYSQSGPSAIQLSGFDCTAFVISHSELHWDWRALHLS